VGFHLAPVTGRGNLPPGLVPVQTSRMRAEAVPLAAALPEHSTERD
jgi:hypothetical protein